MRIMQTVADRHCRWRDLDEAEQAIALLCEDPQWLRAQFEAIIAAEWPQQPPAPPRTGVAVTDTPGADRAPTRSTARVAGPRCAHGPGTDGWARQRSPPAGSLPCHHPISSPPASGR